MMLVFAAHGQKLLPGVSNRPLPMLLGFTAPVRWWCVPGLGCAPIQMTWMRSGGA
jgi:hypothetical protein